MNGKVAARWEPIQGYAVRGSLSNGFRAPSLQQQFFTTTSTNFINGVPVDIATLAVSSPAARALGARDLEPEKSLNISFGATANPFRGLTLTADAYSIRIKDRIVLTETLGTGGTGNTAAVQAQVTTLLANLGFPQVAAARFFINGLDTTTRGLDLVGSYRWRAGGLGNWTLTAAYNYNKTKIDKRLAALGPLSTVSGLVLFGRVEGVRFTDGQPRDKVVLSADGDIGKFGVTARTTRYGKVVSPGATNPIADPPSLTALGPDDILLGAKWITDLEAALQAASADRAGDRREQCVRHLSRPLAVRAAPGRDRGRLPRQPAIYSLFDLLAVRLQRPLPLRPRQRELLGGQGGPAAPPSPRALSGGVRA